MSLPSSQVLEVGTYAQNNRRSFLHAFERCHADPADYQVRY